MSNLPLEHPAPPPPRVFSNRFSGPCVDCQEFVSQGEGAAIQMGPKTWSIACGACCEKRGFELPRGEHFKVTLYGRGHLAFESRRMLSNDKFDSQKLLFEQHGARYDRQLNRMLAPKERALDLVACFREVGFEIRVSDEARIALIAEEERKVRDAEAAEVRIDTLDEKLAKRGMKIYPYQKVGIAWLAERERALLCDEMGLGKSLGHLEPVLTASGKVEIGKLRVGDLVTSSSGEPTRVLGVYPQGRLEVFRLTFADGSFSRCSADHLWPVKLLRPTWEGGVADVVVPLMTIQAMGLLLPSGISRWHMTRIGPAGRGYRQSSVALVSVEPDGVEECVCIAVDAPDHIFVTRGGILTHNTIQTLLALPSANRAKQIEAPGVVLVCPKGAKGVWDREAALWRPDYKVDTIDGKNNFRWPANGEIVVMNYDILPDIQDVEKAPPPNVVVVADESHYLRNKRAQRTGRFRGIAEKARDAGGRTWLLTGTPLVSKPPDLWSLTQCAGLERETWGTWESFKTLFNAKQVIHGPCGECQHIDKHSKAAGCTHVDGRGKTAKKCECKVPTIEHTEWGTPSSEVPERFAKIALRRLRSEVLPDLPSKSYKDYPVKLLHEQKERIAEELPPGWEEALATAIETQSEVGFMGMSSGRQALAEAKIPAMLEVVENFEEEEVPLVVFSCHTAPLDLFRERAGWVVIDGETTSKWRTQYENDFQAGKLKGIAGNVKAMGTAITLTYAANLLFVDRPWNPSDESQCEDRVCRIGQDRGVMIHRLIADHVLDERVSEILDQKRVMIEGSLGK